MLLSLLPVAWLVPERSWPVICNALARAAGFLFPRRQEAVLQRMPLFLAPLMGTTQEGAAVRVTSGVLQEIAAVLRSYRPGGWRPRVNLIGVERLDAALAERRGVILWVADFTFASLVAKMAFDAAGFRIHHLSRPEHGFSTSRFGMRFLNPIQTRIEERYLAGRIVMEPEERITALRHLYRCLAANEIVSIRATDHGSQSRAAPFLDGSLRLATGPVTLARATDASLLPVFTVGRGPGRFDIYIEPPVPVPADRADPGPFLEYAAVLASHVRADPAAWVGWLRTREGKAQWSA